MCSGFAFRWLQQTSMWCNFRWFMLIATFCASMLRPKSGQKLCAQNERLKRREEKKENENLLSASQLPRGDLDWLVCIFIATHIVLNVIVMIWKLYRSANAWMETPKENIDFQAIYFVWSGGQSALCFAIWLMSHSITPHHFFCIQHIRNIYLILQQKLWQSRRKLWPMPKKRPYLSKNSISFWLSCTTTTTQHKIYAKFFCQT